MPNSSRLNWPVPSEFQDPFYEAFTALVGAIDASVYANQEDRNLILMGGGTVAFTAGTGLVTWSATIELLAANVGFLWVVPAGNAVVADGQLLYVEVVRSPTAGVSLTVAVASSIPTGADKDSWLVLGVRRGDRIYWRNGDVIRDGESQELFNVGGGGGSGAVQFQQAGTNVGPPYTKLNFQSGATVADNPGQSRVDVTIVGGIGTSGQNLRDDLATVLDRDTDQATNQVVGQFSFNSGDYVVTGLTNTFKLKAVGNISSGILTGTLELFNLTDSVTVATVTWNGGGDISPILKLSGALALVAANKIYELRLKVTGGSGPGDRVFVKWAGLQIDRVFV